MTSITAARRGRVFSVRHLGLIIILLVLFAAEGAAATVRGYLCHQNGVPAFGIAVRVVSRRIGPSGFSFSGRDGMYYLNGIPAGEYVLEIWLTNKTVWRYPLVVREPMTDFPPIQVP